MDQWNEGFSLILRGSSDERIQFCYKVYDLMRTNKIRKEQIFPMMRGCLIRQQPDEDPDEGVKVKTPIIAGTYIATMKLPTVA